MTRSLLSCLLVLAALATGTARAEDQGAGARAPGMGGAFVPVADDIYTVHYNPAGLGVLERPTLGTAYSLLSIGLKDGSDLGASFAGYAHPLSDGKHGTVAAAWTASSLNQSLYREDSFTAAYGRLLFSRTEKAGSLAGGLYGGLSLKYLRSSFGSFAEADNAVPTMSVIGSGQKDPVLSGPHARGDLDADAGLLYRFGKHYSWGLAAGHLNQPNVAFSRSDSDRLPLSVKTGFNYRSLISNLAFQYDTQRATMGRDHVFSIGAERWFPKLFVGDFGVRGGLSLGTRDYKNLAMGVSYRTRRMVVDYAFSLPIGTSLDASRSHKAALSFRFGRTTEEEETLEMVLEAMKQFKSGQPVIIKAAAKELPKTQVAVLEEYLAQSRGLESKARYEEAMQKFGAALAVAPGDKDLMARFSRLNFVAQQIKSLPDYQKDPAEAVLHLGIQAYLASNDLEAVRKAAESLMLRKDERAELFLAQLELVTGLKRPAETVQVPGAYELAVKLTQANAAIDEGRYDDAAALSLEVLRIDPENVTAWQNLGTAYFALKNYIGSTKAWKRALELEKSPAIRAAIKGYLKSIERALERAPARPAPAAPTPAAPAPAQPTLPRAEIEDMYNRAVDHYTRGELTQARELLEKILAADPNYIEAQKALRRIKQELAP
ncbi:MAG: type IX secretion system membrane protein PorP/SprF [Elusimicrobia bacterium]|nr:type IX secretion system membrane protein PorP/SprF [Elusimicrobiota bacterium]